MTAKRRSLPGESRNGTGGVFVTHHPDRQGLIAQQLGAGGRTSGVGSRQAS